MASGETHFPRVGTLDKGPWPREKNNVAEGVLEGLEVSLQHIEEYVEESAVDSAGRNHTMNEADGTDPKTIKQMVCKNVNASTVQHNQDQAEANGMEDLMQNCSLDANASLGNLSAEGQTVNLSRADHAVCRAGEGNVKDRATITCSEHNSNRKTNSTLVCGCNSLAQECFRADDTEKKQMETCLQDMPIWLVGSLAHEKSEDCQKQGETHRNKSKDGINEQHIFEQAVCNYQWKVGNARAIQNTSRTHSSQGPRNNTEFQCCCRKICALFHERIQR